MKSAVSYSIGKDSRDSRFDPTEGFFTEISETFSGVGGDVNFLRSNLRGGYYKPYLFKSLVFGVKGRLGHISGLGDDVTLSERFFLGGRDDAGSVQTVLVRVIQGRAARLAVTTSITVALKLYQTWV